MNICFDETKIKIINAIKGNKTPLFTFLISLKFNCNLFFMAG
jgi:hypothetical protein